MWQQFKALFKKEIESYLQNKLYYIVIFIYLSVSAVCALYGGAYLSTTDKALYSFFYIQPFILCCVVPALTMKIWGDEYKQGTAEFLLTQPVKDVWIAGAKTVAVFVFCLIVSFLLIGYVGYTYAWLKLDAANILCCFIGLGLVILLLCVLGCFVSAWCKNATVAYIISIFVGALWVFIRQSGFYASYCNFLFAEVGLSDVLYFVSFSGVLFWLNVKLLENRHSMTQNKTLKFYGLAIIVLLAVISFNVLMIKLPLPKADFSGNHIYTLSKQSVQLVENIKKPISIELYIARDYKAANPEYYRYFEQVKRFADNYENVSGGMIRVSADEVEAFSALEKIIIETGLYYETNQNNTKDYFGAVLRDSEGHGVVIKHFLPARQAFLEKDINQALLKLTDQSVLKTVGVYLDTTQNLEDYQGFLLNLENDYNIINISNDIYEISEKMDALILINPKKLSDNLKYAIDQYIMNGGKVIVFLDLVTKNQDDYTNATIPDMVDFLDRWGILLENRLVDKGLVDTKFKISDLPVSLYQALMFSVVNSELQTEAVITADDKYVGAIISGKFQSLYEKNPLKDAKLVSGMNTHKMVGRKEGKIALIGDADVLDDNNWIAEYSPDKNPYSLVANSVNGELLKNLVDYMVGNDEYLQLPVKKQNYNQSAIWQKVRQHVDNKYSEQYLKILNEIEDRKIELYQKSMDNPDKTALMKQINEAGQQIMVLEQQKEALLYKMAKGYSFSIRKTVLINVMILPLCLVICLAGVLKLLAAIKQKSKERMYE